MFARKVAARLKPNSLSEFARLMECEILPWLRKQEGFLDLITLAVPDAQKCNHQFLGSQTECAGLQLSGYPEVLKILGKLLDGTPYIKTFNVVGSTFPTNDTLADALEADTPVQESGSVQLGCR